KHDLLAEDPWPRVDHEVAAADVVRRLVDLADRAVYRFDPEARQVGMGVDDVRAEVGSVAVAPDIENRHVLHVSSSRDVVRPTTYPRREARNRLPGGCERVPGRHG